MSNTDRCNKQKVLVQHVKNSKGRKIGTIVALGPDQLGWSQCNIKLDRFDKAKGIDIAKVRAKLKEKDWLPTNKYMRKVIKIMQKRARKYYGKEFTPTVEELQENIEQISSVVSESAEGWLVTSDYKNLNEHKNLLKRKWPHISKNSDYLITHKQSGEVHGELYWDFKSHKYRIVFYS